MAKKKSRQLPVLSIRQSLPVKLGAFVTGEEIEPRGLPKLKVYKQGENYIFAEGDQEIESALIKSLKHLRESDHTLLFLAVEIVPVPETGGRRRRKTTTRQEGGAL